MDPWYLLTLAVAGTTFYFVVSRLSPEEKQASREPRQTHSRHASDGHAPPGAKETLDEPEEPEERGVHGP